MNGKRLMRRNQLQRDLSPCCFKRLDADVLPVVTSWVLAGSRGYCQRGKSSNYMRIGSVGCLDYCSVIGNTISSNRINEGNIAMHIYRGCGVL